MTERENYIDITYEMLQMIKDHIDGTLLNFIKESCYMAIPAATVSISDFYIDHIKEIQPIYDIVKNVG